jgi:anti-anti-sigma factor
MQIAAEQQGPIFCVRLKHSHFDDDDLEQLGAELARLIDEDGCTRMVLNLGPRELHCLYSLLLAKLIYLHRRLEGSGGSLVLADVTPYVRDLFHVTGVEKFFRFFPDEATAVQALK